MIEDYTDADYLRLLAHWFDQMDKIGKFGDSPGDEVQETLIRIAKRLEEMDKIEGDLMLWAAYLRKKHGLKKNPKVAIFDNPETMMREAWADGRLLVAASMETISEKRAGRFPAEKWPFCLPQTKFIPNQFAGDKEAIWVKLK